MPNPYKAVEAGENVDAVLSFWLHQLNGANDFHAAYVPVAVVKVMCEVAWPGRTFSADERAVRNHDGRDFLDPDGECFLRHMIDDATGETAEELYERDFGAKSSRKRTAAAR
jgi:hypothetical protein